MAGLQPLRDLSLSWGMATHTHVDARVPSWSPKRQDRFPARTQKSSPLPGSGHFRSSALRHLNQTRAGIFLF